LKAEAAVLQIDTKVVWAGFLQGEQKWDALADADVFVLPSYSENCGIAVAEAMAAGLAVIVSNQVAIHPQIAESGAGLVVSCEASSLGSAIVNLLSDSDLRQRMAENGRSVARYTYSVDAIAQKMIAAYETVIH
jgi:glycosyltransferase involved in cell wall biosynthesis